MSLFASLDLSTMSLDGLDELLLIVSAVKDDEVAEAHRSDYEALAGRIEERRRHLKAVVRFQAAVRGVLARQQVERLRREQAVIQVQAAVRGFMARREAERLRAAQRAALDEAHSVLSEARIDQVEEASLDATLRLAMGQAHQEYVRLRDQYSSTVNSKNRKKAPSRRLAGERDRAWDEFEAVFDQLIRTVNAQRQAAFDTRKPDMPEGFAPEGWRDHQGFVYPMGGRLTYRAKTWLLHPGRALVHAFDELPQNAGRILVSAYLAACIDACKVAIDRREYGSKVRVNAATPGGRTFFWNIILKLGSSSQDHGEIFHIDSGYQHSRWRNE